MTPGDPSLIAVPNFSEGRDQRTIAAIAHALTQSGHARLLDTHADPDHHRTVYTLAGAPGELAQAIANGAAEAIARIDLNHHHGLHPRVGALDVAPIVHRTSAQTGAAAAEALVLADLLADQHALPVFLYGALSYAQHTRAELRRGGPERLQQRIDQHDVQPDYGPATLHPTAGATLVAARPPLIAFNIELAPPATEQDAKRIAAAIRDGAPDGMSSVRAIGLWLHHRNRAQISTNIEDHTVTSLAQLIARIADYATPEAAEVIGLPPRAALAGLPPELEIRNARALEDALA